MSNFDFSDDPNKEAEILKNLDQTALHDAAMQLLLQHPEEFKQVRDLMIGQGNKTVLPVLELVDGESTGVPLKGTPFGIPIIPPIVPVIVIGANLPGNTTVHDGNPTLPLVPNNSPTLP